MSTASPIRPAKPDRSPANTLGLAASAVVVVVVGLIWLFFAGGYAGEFGEWMHESAVGIFVRYVLESLMLLVCLLLSTAALIYGERKVWGAVHLRRGPNVVGPHHAYMGPRTPAGPKHRYHLQVFALDTVLQGDPGMTWGQLKAALDGHVLASGQTIGLGSVDPNAPKPAPRPAG